MFEHYVYKLFRWSILKAFEQVEKEHGETKTTLPALKATVENVWNDLVKEGYIILENGKEN